MDRTAEVLAKLVSFPTDSSKKTQYAECAEYIASQTKKLGMRTKILKFKGSDGKPRPNVFASLDAGAKETVLFLSHFDVVPANGWKANPFMLKKTANRLYGRGAADDKAAIASFICAMQEMKKEKQKPKPNVKFLCVCDEEVGGAEGIGLVVKKYPELLRSDFCVTLDGNLDYISHSCCGMVRGTITIHGKGIHSAYDFKTENILHKSFGFLKELSEYSAIRRKKRSFIDAPENPVSGKMFGRFNITILHAGSQHNIIPSSLEAGFDMRLLPEENATKAQKQTCRMIFALAKKHSLKITLSINNTSGYYSNNPKYEKIVRQAVQKTMRKKLRFAAEFGGTDSRYISLLGIPAYNFSPGGHDIHTNTEYITLEELQKTKEFIKKLIC